MVDLPDAVAMAAALWPDFITRSVKCRALCCCENGPTYGQVIFYQEGRTYEAVPQGLECNAEVIATVDEPIFTERLLKMLSA